METTLDIPISKILGTPDPCYTPRNMIFPPQIDICAPKSSLLGLSKIFFLSLIGIDHQRV